MRTPENVHGQPAVGRQLDESICAPVLPAAELAGTVGCHGGVGSILQIGDELLDLLGLRAAIAIDLGRQSGAKREENAATRRDQTANDSTTRCMSAREGVFESRMHHGPLYVSDGSTLWNNPSIDSGMQSLLAERHHMVLAALGVDHGVGQPTELGITCGVQGGPFLGRVGARKQWPRLGIGIRLGPQKELIWREVKVEDRSEVAQPLAAVAVHRRPSTRGQYRSRPLCQGRHGAALDLTKMGFPPTGDAGPRRHALLSFAPFVRVQEFPPELPREESSDGALA